MRAPIRACEPLWDQASAQKSSGGATTLEIMYEEKARMTRVRVGEKPDRARAACMVF